MNDARDDDPTVLAPGLEGIDGLVRSACAPIVAVGAVLIAGTLLLDALLPIGSRHVWKAIGGYLLLLVPVFAFLRLHRPHRRFGPANTVTLLRGAMVCLLASLYGEPWGGLELLVACVAAVALSLDGVDGWLARLRGTQSRFGARFDMETDALLVLVLSLLAWQSGKAGPWVLAVGLMRYGFLGAALAWSWLSRPLPESQRRKTVCVLQLIALIACVAPVLPDPWRTAAAVDAVLLAAWSFGLDIAWLHRRRALPRVAG
jgi:phosphatidylglycerophosphate synthase